MKIREKLANLLSKWAESLYGPQFSTPVPAVAREIPTIADATVPVAKRSTKKRKPKAK